MTQLPEAEVIRKDLEKEVVGKRFKDITVKTASMVGHHRNRPEFTKALTGRKITGVGRRGTILLFELDDDLVFVLRLGAGGIVSRETATEEAGRHTQLVATFTTGGALHYMDTDKDGEVCVLTTEELAARPDLQPRGIDPLADVFTWPAFSEQLRGRSTTLKQALTDEDFIVGLGDLYSDEILWAAGLSGGRHTSSLSSQEVRRLYRAVLEVLYEAVKQGGAGEGDITDADDFGDEQELGGHIRVYGKDGQPCGRCRTPIERSDVAGHDSYRCPQCQT